MERHKMVTTKRWNDPREESDGVRILVTRYRPRALPKADETWDIWIRDLGPSAELHAAFYGKNGPRISWSDYRVAYLREMKRATAAIRRIVELMSSGERVTLLCSSACIHDDRCHRSILRGLIAEEAQRHRVTCATHSSVGLVAHGD
jgi:uncharacterized protein YeaO (DUF488 family)